MFIIYYGTEILSLFNRIKNIIRSNINSKESVYENDFGPETNFENFRPTFEDEEFVERVEQAFEKKANPKSDSLEHEYYANLELPYGAGFDEIKSAYRHLLKKYHPDKFYGNPQKLKIAQDVVKKLNIAYNYFEQKYNR